MRKTKILNSLLVVFNILIIMSLIIALIIKTKLAYSLYWFIVPLLILLLILVIREWSKRGQDSDIDKSKIDKSKTIQRSFDDTTTLSTVFYGLIYLIIMFIDTFNENIKNSPYILIGFFIITVIYELFIYLAIYNANKETAKLLKEQHNK